MDDPSRAPDAAGPLGEDARAVLDAARASADAYVGGFDALRRLFAAEVGLARDALVAALVWLLVATVLLGTAYLLLTALLVSGLRAAGAPWPLAIAIPLVISVGVAAFGVLRAKAMLRHADFEGTRRQLKLGFGQAPAGAEAPADAAAREAAP
ncbi:MAG TPA: hypothetical protein VFQ84_03040 [Arenimonas sp.]|uniref:hypothetical protein n=1 Tax=Arenimonas sp. TaxID=1872635 RepID=UPI002D7EED2E|nr:hypothetical protein [Arenimonas sp.]HEU0152304.1 hypothetical protein [Arenimonas sp.]